MRGRGDTCNTYNNKDTFKKEKTRKKKELRKAKRLAQSRTASKRQSWDLSEMDLMDFETYTLYTKLHHLPG